MPLTRAIWNMVGANMLQELAKFSLDGFAHLHTLYGIPDTMTLTAIAQRIDGYLTKACSGRLLWIFI